MLFLLRGTRSLGGTPGKFHSPQGLQVQKQSMGHLLAFEGGSAFLPSGTLKVKVAGSRKGLTPMHHAFVL